MATSVAIPRAGPAEPSATPPWRGSLEQHWHGWGGTLRNDEFADQEAVAAVISATAGNFRLIDRLMSQVRRIKDFNQLQTATREVVEAARDCLVIGAV